MKSYKNIIEIKKSWNLWYISKSTNRIYGSTVEYTRIHYTAWEYCLLFAQPIQASFSDITGVDPITQIIEKDTRRVVGAGHTSAQIGDYRKQEYSSQKQITVKTIVGNPLGNTTIQTTGNGLTYRIIKLLPTSSSVAISLWALARCQLWSTDVWRWVKQLVCACSIFSNLEPNVNAFGSIKCLHVLRGYEQTNWRLVLNNQPTIQRDWNNKGTETWNQPQGFQS